MEKKQMQVNGMTFELMLGEDSIKARVKELAKQVKNDMGEDSPIFISVLNGSFVFAADFTRYYEGDCEIHFIKLSSYCGTCSTGNVIKTIGIDGCLVKNRRVVIIEDIVETGCTMQALIKELESFEPKDIHIAALFVKPEKLKDKVKVDYRCFDISNEFIIGYGLDLDRKYRNLPDVYRKV
ncbi:MAG: hypoxanthine phosphoribosyltransferase [Prevotellaceae bacterium]|nr:hypoxanthine phosphoribosyltransferase [Candidatus Faecinaster equi]